MATIDVDRSAADRRLFLARTALCAGGLFCLGCRGAQASTRQAAAPPVAPQKFGEDSKMKFKDVYAFAYARNYVPLMKALGEDIGRDRLLSMLQAASAKAAAHTVSKTAPPPPKNTLAAWTAIDDEYFWSHVLSMRFIENTEKAVEIRVTECLWAATFRGQDAGDIGYATICHADFAATTAFNPKIKLTRTKTLMQGHDCCNHRYVLET